jgi:hypothetical protein
MDMLEPVGLDAKRLPHLAAPRQGFERNYFMLIQKLFPTRTYFRVIGVSDFGDLDTV